MRDLIEFPTQQREELVDITDRVVRTVAAGGHRNGVVHLYAQGATAAIMIQENWDDSIPNDVVDLFQQLVPRGVWRHDAQDGNADSHLKAGIVGPSESIPLIDGRLGLSTWQGIFFCEFDGPRRQRTVVCSVVPLAG